MQFTVNQCPAQRHGFHYHILVFYVESDSVNNSYQWRSPFGGAIHFSQVKSEFTEATHYRLALLNTAVLRYLTILLYLTFLSRYILPRIFLSFQRFYTQCSQRPGFLCIRLLEYLAMFTHSQHQYPMSHHQKPQKRLNYAMFYYSHSPWNELSKWRLQGCLRRSAKR